MSVLDVFRASSDGNDELHEGARVGRFVVLRDVEGTRHALAAASVAAACEAEDGATVIMLPGGKLLRVPQRLDTVLTWLDGRGCR